jgi:hypothetical protein
MSVKIMEVVESATQETAAPPTEVLLSTQNFTLVSLICTEPLWLQLTGKIFALNIIVNDSIT